MNPRNRRTRTVLRARDVGGLSAVSAAGRAMLGASLMLAPKRTLAALGFSATEESLTIARIAGVRDLVLAASTLLALGDADRLRAASLASAAADGGDALVFAAALRQARQGGAAGAGEARHGAAAARGLPAATAASVSSLWVAWRLR